MRARTAVMLALATLAASPAAFAQRASLADRVAALEARAAADQGATELDSREFTLTRTVSTTIASRQEREEKMKS